MHVLCYYELLLYDFSLTFCPFILFLHFMIFSFFFKHSTNFYISKACCLFMNISFMQFSILVLLIQHSIKVFLVKQALFLKLFVFLGVTFCIFLFLFLYLGILFLLMGLFKYMMSMACSFIFKKDDPRKLIKSLSHGNGLSTEMLPLSLV